MSFGTVHVTQHEHGDRWNQDINMHVYYLSQLFLKKCASTYNMSARIKHSNI